MEKILRASHTFEREEHGHYVEPLNVDRMLIRYIRSRFDLPINATILDPCCGFGRIPRAAAELGFNAVGYDIVPRWQNNPDNEKFPNGCSFTVMDYLKYDSRNSKSCFDAIVMNPPYHKTRQFIEKALTEVAFVAAIVPATWINGVNTAKWLKETNLSIYLAISPRPSMPPGDYLLRGEKEGGGTKDFSVLIWSYTTPAIVDWLFWKDEPCTV